MSLIRILLPVIFLAPLIPVRAQSEGSMEYVLSMPKPETHYYHVIFRCNGIHKDTLDLTMPAWTPGYYQILDYAQNLEHFRASDAQGRELGWEKATPNVWRVPVPGKRKGPVVVEYDIRATTQFVAQSWLDTTRGYVTPASVFFYVAGYLQHPVTVTVQPWPKWGVVATGMDTVAGRRHVYRAPDLDVLYDSPILVGDLETLPPFYVQGIPHYFTG